MAYRMCQTPVMTSTYTHTAALMIAQDDVSWGIVTNVAAGAIKALGGPPRVRSEEVKTSRVSGRELVTVHFDYFAANDNEATRTAKVLRSSILPLVRGCTIVSCGPILRAVK